MRDALIAELARLGSEERERVVQDAVDRRKRTIRTVLGQIRRTHLADMSGRSAAREIWAAANGRRLGSKDPVLRRLIAAQLKENLGDLGDLPGESAIRQMPEFSHVFDL
jgi:hypothetical protein